MGEQTHRLAIAMLASKRRKLMRDIEEHEGRIQELERKLELERGNLEFHSNMAASLGDTLVALGADLNKADAAFDLSTALAHCNMAVSRQAEG